MNDQKRQKIESRIVAAQARNAARERTIWEDAGLMEHVGDIAADAKDRFTQFAREHPVAVVAGGLVAGILVSALFKGSPTRKLGGKAAGLAAIGTELALAYAHRAMVAAEETGRVGAENLDDLGDSIGDTARGVRRDAGYLASGASDNARIAARKAGKRLGRALRHRLN